MTGHPAQSDESRPELSLVVSTLGRPMDLEALLESVRTGVGAEPVEVIVVDQSAQQVCAPVVDAFPGPPPVRYTVSARGASLGRNVGARLAAGTWLCFPDDNARFAPDTLRRFRDAVSTWATDIVCGIQVTPDGAPSMLRWLSDPTVVTRRNLHRTSIESTIFIQRQLFWDVGGFDDALGAGSPSPFQAGEGTDLMLRALDSGASAMYDPRVRIVQDDPAGEPPPGYTVKMRGYGRGFGHLYRRHHLSRAHLSAVVARKAAAVVIRGLTGSRRRAAADAAFARGALEGYFWPAP